MYSASEVIEKLLVDDNWLVHQDGLEAIVDSLSLDAEIPALNVDINLRHRELYSLSSRLLDRVRALFPLSDLALYHSALSAAGERRFDQVIDFARRAVALAPWRFEYRSCLIRACAVDGRFSEARNVIRTTSAHTISEMRHLTELVQFVDFCSEYTLPETKAALARLQQEGGYCEPQGVANLILSAVRDKRPFSMVRLGDGEGAWVRQDAYDEGRFSALYRANRVAFLNDWFGSDHLLDDMEFREFAYQLQVTFQAHDLIGLPPLERLHQEEGFMSIRGIPSAINAFRILGLLKGPACNTLLCSNSINLSLAFHTNFYRSLFQSVQKISVITSQRGLASQFTSAGLEVVNNYIVPGDSRNFHRTDEGVPQCQYPDYVARVDSELAASSLQGMVFLVAAGFVGKRYLHTIRSRGGIAIDLGALADHWVKHGVPH